VRAQTYTRFAPRPRLPLYDKGVDLKRRPPKSRPTALLWRIASPPKGGPQGLRRPRFSFFRFTCQTARDDASPILGRTEGRRSHELPTEIGSGPASKSEELRRRAIAPSRGRHAVFALYTLRPLRMSTRHGQKSYSTHLQHETAARGPIPTLDPPSRRARATVGIEGPQANIGFRWSIGFDIRLANPRLDGRLRCDGDAALRPHFWQHFHL
jgi:hypothetical protein